MFVLRAVDTLLLLFPHEAPPLLQKMLEKILSLTLSDQETDVAVVQYLSVFARIALQNTPHRGSATLTHRSRAAFVPARLSLRITTRVALHMLFKMNVFSRPSAPFAGGGQEFWCVDSQSHPGCRLSSLCDVLPLLGIDEK